MSVSVSAGEGEGVVCAVGVRRGAHSRVFTALQVLRDVHAHRQHVYLETDSGGYLVASGGRDASAVCARAALAPHVLAAALLLDVAPAGLRLRAAAPLPPHADALLWFTHDALAALHMPFLTPRNIRDQHYVCHLCAATFPDPNPLKVHMFLSCEPYERTLFWQTVAARLPPPDCTALALPPAQLEALATEWGRGQGGHRCVYCGKLYSRRYGLKIHIRTHTGYRPLRCRYCLRAFGDPSNLNKHVRLHAARDVDTCGAAHRCGVCGRALGRRRDLLRHLRAHHAPVSHTNTKLTEE